MCYHNATMVNTVILSKNVHKVTKTDYMWFEFLSFNQKTLQMRWEAKNLIGKDQDFRESIHIYKKNALLSLNLNSP